MRQRDKVFKEVRYKVAQEVLAGIQEGVLGKKCSEDGILTIDERLDDAKRLAELQERYNRALKVLGEKELENEILRELVQKTLPR